MTQNQAAPANGQVDWYHPGEIVIVAHDHDGAFDPRQVHAALRDRLGDAIPQSAATSRAFTFTAPRQPALVFLIQKLSETSSAVSVKKAVETLHGQLDGLSTAEVDVLTVMRSEEHTSELQSHVNLVCRLL